jgi:hypothetical protein
MYRKKKQPVADTSADMKNSSDTAAMASDSTLFLLTASLFLAVLLVGLPGIVIDILIIFSLLLTGAAFFIAALARKLSDVKGFGVLASFVTLLQLTGNVSAVRAILLTGGAGRVVNWCGAAIYGGLMSIILYSASALIAIVFILGGWRFIFHQTAESLRQILPFGTVSSETGRRATFFKDMIIVAKLSVCAAIIAFMTACVTLAGAMAHVNKPAGAIGASCLTLVPAILIVGGSLILINKQFLIVRENQEFETSDLRTAAIYVKSREIRREKPSAQNTANHTTSTQPSTDESMDHYYDRIISAVQNTNASVILLAGEKIGELPVTAAVNIAVRFAYMNKRSLLIDTDASRNAVARAFEADSIGADGKAVKTCIENLWICPADDPTLTHPDGLAKKIAQSRYLFEQVVIYSPNAGTDHLKNQFAGIVHAAVFFGKGVGLKSLLGLLTKSDCHVIFETALFNRP